MAKRIAQFSKVSLAQFEKDWIGTFGNDGKDIITEIYNNIKLPKRATRFSAGHDISIPFDASVIPRDTLKIPTGLRCEMDEDYVMLVAPRSSLGIKHGMVLSNTLAIIDCDYASAKNEGHIFLCVKNNSHELLKLKAGDNITQAVFVPYGVADTEEVTTERTGGIGSTTK